MAFPRSPLEGGTEVGNACDCIDQQWCSTQRGPPQELKEPCPPLCRCEDQPSTRSVCQQERLWMAHCACLGTAVQDAPAVTAVCCQQLHSSSPSLALQWRSSLSKDNDRVSVHSKLHSCHRAKDEGEELCSLSLHTSCLP